MVEDREEGKLFCPVRAAKCYLSGTDQYCPICSNLFIGKVKKMIGKDTILFRLWAVINEAHRSASDEDSTAVKGKTHEV